MPPYPMLPPTPGLHMQTQDLHLTILEAELFIVDASKPLAAWQATDASGM